MYRKIFYFEIPRGIFLTFLRTHEHNHEIIDSSIADYIQYKGSHVKFMYHHWHECLSFRKILWNLHVPL